MTGLGAMFQHLKRHVQKNEENANHELLSIFKLQLPERSPLSLLTGKRRGPSVVKSQSWNNRTRKWKIWKKKQVAMLLSALIERRWRFPFRTRIFLSKQLFLKILSDFRFKEGNCAATFAKNNDIKEACPPAEFLQRSKLRPEKKRSGNPRSLL